ncbi:MAG: S8 family serine peptidase, partial [Bacteroidales bacterium]|nr:S8 family serine peptidase [Bacteroidales bacterium]
MKRIVLLMLVVYCAVANAQLNNTNESYYYYNGETINLTINNNRFVVYFNTNMICLDTIKKRFTTGKELPLAKDKPNNVYACEVVIANNNYDSVRQSLASKNYIIDVEPVIGTDSTIMVSNLLYVKLKNANDYALLENWANQTNSTIVRQSQYSSKWYVLEVSKQSSGSSIAVANILSQTDLFDKVDPGFVIPFRENTIPCVTDNAFNYQWGMRKINACDAWSITTGKPTVKVAVLDQGIDENHMEFNGVNVAGSFDTETETQPAVIYGDHGTHVGGIIFANHNYGNIAGLAPNCSMLNISNRLRINETLSENLANGIYWALSNKADVINNSWGDQGSVFYDYLHSTYLEDALDSAIDYGRDGKGCVIVFGAGNCFPNMDYPATYRKEILTVGAADSNFIKCSFSATGLLLDVVAPGYEILSTLPYGLNGNMSGTSMAAPHAAGLAALILSANPNLTGQQVRDIIEQTAQKVGPDPYVDLSQYNYNNGLWNPKMGYGFINAHAAVNAALDYDLYTKDNENDDGSEPSNITDYGLNSPDIWVRNAKDGGTSHQIALMGDTNYVYVRVHNRNDVPSLQSDSIKLFAKWNVITSQPILDYTFWPNYWRKIAVASIPSIQSHKDTVICLHVMFDNLINRYTLLSRIESLWDPLNATETQNTIYNLRFNNNISIKSVSAARFFTRNLQPGYYMDATVSVESSSNPFRIKIGTVGEGTGANILDEAEVTLILSDNLASYWQNNDVSPTGLKQMSDNTYMVENENVTLDNFSVPEGYDADLTLKYNFLTRKNTPNN